MTGWGPRTQYPGSGGGGGGNPDLPDDAIPYFFEITNVPAMTPTTIGTFVVPPVGASYQLASITFGGTNIAKYELFITGIKKEQYYTYYGGGLEGVWAFDGLGIGAVKLPPSGTVEVKVEHQRPMLGDFHVRMLFILIDVI